MFIERTVYNRIDDFAFLSNHLTLAVARSQSFIFASLSWKYYDDNITNMNENVTQRLFDYVLMF